MRPFSAREEFSREAFNKIKTKKKKIMKQMNLRNASKEQKMTMNTV